ncbi:MAG TPA: hypothetical protein VGG32_07070 [Thermoplasmata archaeon]|jgi:hypothetical protein
MPEEYPLRVKLECRKCGREVHVDGRYVRHQGGAVSFIVHNTDKPCYLCTSDERADAARRE